jgi:hypothetical protein
VKLRQTPPDLGGKIVVRMQVSWELVFAGGI